MREFTFETNLRAMGINKAYKVSGKTKKGTNQRWMYKDPDYAKYQNKLRRQIKKSFNLTEIFTKNVKVYILHSYKTKHGRDVDGPVKGILDSMNKIVYLDDNQIKDLHVRILEGTEDGIKIKIVEL